MNSHRFSPQCSSLCEEQSAAGMKWDHVAECTTEHDGQQQQAVLESVPWLAAAQAGLGTRCWRWTDSQLGRQHAQGCLGQ